MLRRRQVIMRAASLAAPFLWPVRVSADAGAASFNTGGITWHSYAEGLERAQVEGKPIYMLVHATWCPTCRAFRSVFFERRVEVLSQKLIFVLVDRDQEPEISQAYAPDGDYIPRSMILSPEGVLQEALDSGRSDYRYFLPVEEPGPLIGLLEQAMRSTG